MLQLPLLTPRLSSLWVRFVTRARWSVAREIVLGLTSDLLAADELSLRRIKELVASGVSVPETQTRTEYEQLYGKLSVSVVRLRAADFGKDVLAGVAFVGDGRDDGLDLLFGHPGRSRITETAGRLVPSLACLSQSSSSIPSAPTPAGPVPGRAAGRTTRRWTAREVLSCPLPKVSA